jgi:hypothetical protein
MVLRIYIELQRFCIVFYEPNNPTAKSYAGVSSFSASHRDRPDFIFDARRMQSAVQSLLE